MKKEQIVFGDWKRLFLGDAPAAFLLESFIRTLIIYVILIAVTRLLGKRMAGQLTVTEMAVMLTLGGIVSIAMQMPDRGLLQGILGLGCALVFQRGLTWLECKSERIDRLSQGSAKMLVKDGVLQLEEMRASRISREQLFATLRSRGIFELGKLKRVYMEACGNFGIYQTEEDKPGLSTLPPSDGKMRDAQQRAQGPARVCLRCGFQMETMQANATCPHCRASSWGMPVLEKVEASHER